MCARRRQIGRKEEFGSGTGSAEGGGRSVLKNDSCEKILLALREELGTSWPLAESILVTRKDESVAGDAKGEEGRGT